MRQRPVRSRNEIIEKAQAWIAENPKENAGGWRELFPEKNAPLYLEIGSGKGEFLTQKALADPAGNYIACEGGEQIWIRVIQKAEALNLPNIRVISEYMDHPAEYFKEGELDGIFINFCDPWPKSRHEKRRLTYRVFLEEYKKILKPGGFIAFKTDNDPLFEFSLEEFAAADLQCLRMTRDLYASEWIEENIATEYETKFHNSGKTINYGLYVTKALE